MPKPCKECPPDSRRPAPYPGPRCATHNRVFKDKQKKANHDRMVSKTYGLEAGEYGRLYAAQGGKCAICQHATGKVKRLAVDHDHETGLVRGLLCGPCNQLVGYFKNNHETFRRAADYLDRAAALNQGQIGGKLDSSTAVL